MSDVVEVVEEEVVEEVVDEVQDTEVVDETKDVNLDDYIPKSKALDWKRQLKDTKRKIAEYETKDLEAEETNRLTRIKDTAIEKGLDEDTTDVLMSMAGEFFKSIPKKDIIASEVEIDIDELKDTYPGIKERRDEIIKTVKTYRTANPDFSVEDAYKLLTPTKTPRELQTEIEQKAAISKDNTEPDLQGGVKLTKSLLDEDEKRILKLMQKNHPDKGWTEKKYYDLIKKKKR